MIFPQRRARNSSTRIASRAWRRTRPKVPNYWRDFATLSSRKGKGNNHYLFIYLWVFLSAKAPEEAELDDSLNQVVIDY